jgi:hypothetical protein
MTKLDDRRFIAVDIRVNRLGYAVLETTGKLLDSGVKRFVSPKVAGTRMAALCEVFRPSAIIFRKESVRAGRTYPKVRSIRRELRLTANQLGLPLAYLSERTVLARLGDGKMITKHEVASFIVKLFPELAWRLRTRRKAWEAEPWGFAIFDAVALAVVYGSQSGAVLEAEPSEVKEQSPFAGPSMA